MAGEPEMIYIAVALYPEAKSLIKALNLQKTSEFRWQIFASEKVTLIITGTGQIASAAGVSYILAESSPSDYLINIGTAAAGKGRKKQLYLADQITNLSTNRVFYPDVFLDLPEASLSTGNSIYRSGDRMPDDLYDLEGAAVYEAASFFLGPSHILILKTVSDYGEQITARDIDQRMSENADTVLSVICSLSSEHAEEESIDMLAENLQCSVTMKRELSTLIHYAGLMGISWQSFFDQYTLPVKEKREGKEIIHAFRTYLQK